MGPFKLAAMAWRNLWRNTRRTIITLASVAFAVFLAVLMTGVQDWSWEEVINTAARLGSGHVTVQHAEYQEQPALSRTINASADVLSRVRALSHVTGATPRIGGQVMLSTARDSAGAGFIAYDPAQESTQTLSILGALQEGALFRGADDAGIILGWRLARNLGAELGSKIVYTLTDRHGEIVNGLARVSGIVRTGSPSADLGLCFLPIGTVRTTLGYGPDEVTQLAVFTDDQRRSEAVAAAIGSSVPGAVALSWKETQPDLVSMIAMKRGGTTFFEILILVLCAAGIFNTLFVSVMERLREFGVLVAIGMSPALLFLMIMLESLWLSLIGLAAAALVTALPYHHLATTGVDLSARLGTQQADVAGIGMSMVLKVGIYPENALVIAAAAVVATLAAGLYPAWRAGRVEPVDAIKLV